MDLIFIGAVLLLVVLRMYKVTEILEDISESLRMLANNPKTIDEAKKIRLQTRKEKD